MLANVSFNSSQSLCTRYKICNQTKQKLKAFKCVNCIFATNTYTKFLLHLKPKINSSQNEQKQICKSFKCSNCMFVTKSKIKLALHCVNTPKRNISVHDKSYFCYICDKSFINKNALSRHMHHNTFDVVSKKKIEEIKKTKLYYQRNVSTMSNEIQVKEKNSIFVTKKNNTSTAHQNNENGFDKKCSICDLLFVSSKTFNTHLLLHKASKNICSVCNKEFILRKWFEKHLLSHKDETTNRIKQNDCSTSINESHLLDSQRIFGIVARGNYQNKTATVGSKNNCSLSVNDVYISKNQKALINIANCKNVPKTKKQQNLVKLKLLQCSYCNNYYKTKKYLMYHINREHLNNKKVPKMITEKCQFCSLLITTSNMLRHVRIIHPNVDMFKCDHCSMTFKHLSLKKLHKDQCYNN